MCYLLNWLSTLKYIKISLFSVLTSIMVVVVYFVILLCSFFFFVVIVFYFVHFVVHFIINIGLNYLFSKEMHYYTKLI